MNSGVKTLGRPAYPGPRLVSGDGKQGCRYPRGALSTGEVDHQRAQAMEQVQSKAPSSTISSRSRFVAATMRKSLRTSLEAPIGRKVRSLQNPQKGLLHGRSELSDLVEERVPLSARPINPVRPCSAPVKAPFSCPKRALSISCSGWAAQSTTTKGLRGPRAVTVDGAGEKLLAGACFTPVTSTFGVGCCRLGHHSQAGGPWQESRR